MFLFGSGNVIAKASGSAPAVFGTLQEIEIDVDQQIQELFGQNKMPDAIGHGQMKITGKAKIGQFRIDLANNLLLGQTVATGQQLLAFQEVGNIPGSSTYTITVTKSANFVDDFGVQYADSGIALTPVSSVTAAGQYSVNVATGVYTFYSADASKKVLISYTYTASTGHKMVLVNQQMGIQPVFTMVLQNSFSNFGSVSTLNLQLNRCVASKLSLPFKNTDFAVQDFEFEAFADASGNIGILSVNE